MRDCAPLLSALFRRRRTTCRPEQRFIGRAVDFSIYGTSGTEPARRSADGGSAIAGTDPCRLRATCSYFNAESRMIFLLFPCRNRATVVYIVEKQVWPGVRNYRRYPPNRRTSGPNQRARACKSYKMRVA